MDCYRIRRKWTTINFRWQSRWARSRWRRWARDGYPSTRRFTATGAELFRAEQKVKSAINRRSGACHARRPKRPGTLSERLLRLCRLGGAVSGRRWRGGLRRHFHRYWWRRLRDYQPGDEVSKHGWNQREREKNQHHPDQANDGGIHVEIFGDAAADAAQFAICGRAHQALLRTRCGAGRAILPCAAVVAEIRIFSDFLVTLHAIHRFILPSGPCPSSSRLLYNTNRLTEKFHRNWRAAACSTRS